MCELVEGVQSELTHKSGLFNLDSLYSGLLYLMVIYHLAYLFIRLLANCFIPNHFRWQK